MDLDSAFAGASPVIGPVVVFDIGGTLIHPDFLALRAWTVAKITAHVSTQVVERAFRLAIAGDVFARPGGEIQTQASCFFSKCACPPSMSPLWAEWWKEIVDSGGVGSWLYRVLDPEAIGTLFRLRQLGCSLIAASNSDGTLQAELRSHGLLELFDQIYDSADLGVAKPASAFYERVLRTTRAGAAVHVGDDLIKDVIAATAAGFRRTILYDPASIYEGVPSHVRIRRLSEIPAAIGFE